MLVKIWKKSRYFILQVYVYFGFQLRTIQPEKLRRSVFLQRHHILIVDHRPIRPDIGPGLGWINTAIGDLQSEVARLSRPCHGHIRARQSDAQRWQGILDGAFSSGAGVVNRLEFVGRKRATV